MAERSVSHSIFDWILLWITLSMIGSYLGEKGPVITVRNVNVCADSVASKKTPTEADRG